MNDYTPTTEREAEERYPLTHRPHEEAEAFVAGAKWAADSNAATTLHTFTSAQLDQIRADVWDEGLLAGADRWMDAREFGDKPVNPYRLEGAHQ